MSRRSSIRRSSLAALALASTCMQYVDALPAPINDIGRFQHRASVCSSSGYSGDTDSYQDSSDSTYSACAAACAQQTQCKSFAYGDDECHLFDVPVDGNFKADSDSPYKFYDISCPRPSTTSGTAKKTTTSAIRSSTPVRKATTPASTTAKQSSTTCTTTRKSTTATPSTAKPTTATSSKQTTTTMTTKVTTMATSTTTKKAATSSAVSKPASGPTNAKSSAFSKDVCTSKTFSDPNNKGCGCSYTESCGGGVGSGEIIEAGLSSVTYNACVAACDARPSECVGVVYQPFYGECWLYKSAGNSRKDPNAWFAKKSSCNKPCAA